MNNTVTQLALFIHNAFVMSLLRSIPILFFAVLFGCQNHDREVHLIPNGYIGKVQIIYDIPEGMPIEYDDRGWRVYRIPENGVLLSQFSPNPGGFRLDDREFFYVDNQKKTKIDWFTGIDPRYRDIEKSIKMYPDLVCVYGITLTSGRLRISKDPDRYATHSLIYFVDSLKNISKY